MAYDFKASQLRTNQIINSGSSATSPLLIYGLGSAIDELGTFNQSHFAGTGSDVWMFVSGTRGSADAAGSYGSVAFKGDVVVSGALQLGESTAPGTPTSGKGVLYVKASDSLVYFKNDLGSEYSLTSVTIAGANTQVQFNDNGSLGAKSTFTFATGTDCLSVSHASLTTLTSSFVSPATSLVIRPQSNSLTAGSDTFFLVSGSDASALSVFTGRVVTSGTIQIKNSSAVGTVTLTPAGYISGSSDAEFGASLTVGGTALFNGNVIRGGSSLLITGSDVRLKANSGGRVKIESSTELSGSLFASGSIIPNADVLYNLGSPNIRWANVYTGDLHLRNDRGDWTVIEEESFLRIVNNKTGKNFKMLMEPID